MALEDNAIEDITEHDLNALVAAGVEEGRTLEFKLQLPGSSDAERKEFLADVSSFANAVGGLIIYGSEPRLGVRLKCQVLTLLIPTLKCFVSTT